MGRILKEFIICIQEFAVVHPNQKATEEDIYLLMI